MPVTAAASVALARRSGYHAGMEGNTKKKIPAEPTLFGGFGKREITPEPGTFGSLRLSPTKRALSVRDPLFATAMFLRSGETGLLVIALDVVGVSELTVERIAADASRRTGVAPDRVMVAASHTHQGPETQGEEPEIDIAPILDGVVNGATDAAAQAVSQAQPVRIGWGTCAAPEATKNRFHARLGTEGPVDPTVDILRVESTDGTLLGTLWHLGAHATTAMLADFVISADYPGVVNRMLEDAMGGVSLFLNGAAGNINPVLGERSFQQCETVGTHVAQAILAALPGIRCTAEAATAADSRRVTVPWTNRTDLIRPQAERDEVLRYFRGISTREPAADRYRSEWPTYQRLRTSWWRYRLLDELAQRQEEELLLTGLRIADRVLIGVPGEPFLELQMSVQRLVSGGRPLLVGYSGGYVGYIPDEASFEHQTYETNPSWVHRMGAQAGTRIVDAATELTRRLLVL